MLSALKQMASDVASWAEVALAPRERIPCTLLEPKEIRRVGIPGGELEIVDFRARIGSKELTLSLHSGDVPFDLSEVTFASPRDILVRDLSDEIGGRRLGFGVKLPR